MSDLRALVSAAARLEGAPFVVATVVGVRGSAYRREGARMIVGEERWMAGSVSGGCLEDDVVRKGWWRTRVGPALVTYDASDGYGLGCGGAIDVLLERGESNALRFVARCLEEQARGAMATVFRTTSAATPIGARVFAGARGVERTPMGDEAFEHIERDLCTATRTTTRRYELAEGTIDALVEIVRPPPRLFVFGAGHDAAPVIDLARVVGWDVAVCARRARLASRVRADDLVTESLHELRARVDASDRAAAVVMNHQYDRDRDVLAMLLASRARYIGVLGPRARTAQMLRDVDRATDDRVHAPVGLAIGSESPAEIALAIVAQIQAALGAEAK